MSESGFSRIQGAYRPNGSYEQERGRLASQIAAENAKYAAHLERQRATWDAAVALAHPYLQRSAAGEPAPAAPQTIYDRWRAYQQTSEGQKYRAHEPEPPNWFQ